MMISNRPATLFSPANAEAQAQILQAGDSDWTYEAIHDPQGTGWSFIEIRDEDGDLIGKI
jgi:hypothetical protein